jgi:hypothetical protein
MCDRILCDNGLFLHWIKGYAKSASQWPMDDANRHSWQHMISFIEEQIASHEKDKAEKGTV